MPLKIHKLKTDGDIFYYLLCGMKNFEVRRNDRGFKVGDWLLLKELHKDGRFTGREVLREIIFILNGGQYGIEEGYCVLGLKEL